MLTLFHPEFHPVFETLGYAGGFAFYRRTRNRTGDFLTDERRWLIIAATAIGALIGSRILGLLEQAPRNGFHAHDLLRPGGKTIVGGLLGGWIAVELTKRIGGIRTRTGDLFAIPICLGVAIGRVGCFLAGLPDDTYGTATRLPWGVNFGDGFARHPTQLYELIFLLLLAWLLHRMTLRPHANGIIFRLFLAAYFTWRIAIDFLKPEPHVAGMNLIQWACVGGLIALAIAELLPIREVSHV